MFRTTFLFLFFVLTGCSSLDPISISSDDVDLQKSLIFQANKIDIIAATKASFSNKGWKLLYEGDSLPDKNYSHFSNVSHNPFRPSSHDDRYDQIAIDKALRSDLSPSYYLQAKTPTSAFSFGAELFVVVFEAESQGTVLSIAASTGQAFEKKNLGLYIKELSTLINEHIDQQKR